MVDEKPYILLMEDDQFLGEIYVKKLMESGFEVQVANDGEQGLAALKERKPDLVLLDIVMPNLDGFAVLEKVKADKNLARIPVILLTNLWQPEDIERGKKLGADAYVVKAHFTPKEVVNKIKEVLSAARQKTQKS